MQGRRIEKEGAMGSNANGEFTTVIGPDAVFKGELKFEKGVRHLGTFEGQIETKGHLLIAEGAHLTGEVIAGNIDVEGTVKGNLTSTGKVCLTSSARLEGDLHTARLEVADGAVFVGRCVVGTKDAVKPPLDKPAAVPAKAQQPVALKK